MSQLLSAYLCRNPEVGRARTDSNYGLSPHGGTRGNNTRRSLGCEEYPGSVSYRSYGAFDSYLYTEGIAREFDILLRGSLSGLRTQSCMSHFEFLSWL